MGAGSPSRILEPSKKFSKAFETTVERCVDKPDENHWDSIQSSMNAWF